jgi:ATP-dependent Clp protease ATP-binding subunit ClpC
MHVDRRAVKAVVVPVGLASVVITIVVVVIAVMIPRVRMQVEKHVGLHPERNMIGNIPSSPRVKKVLALAFLASTPAPYTSEHLTLAMGNEAIPEPTPHDPG